MRWSTGRSTSRCRGRRGSSVSGPPSGKGSTSDNEAWLYRLPDALISALSRLTDERSDSVAAAWFQTEEMRLDGWERAEEARLGMYIWGSL